METSFRTLALLAITLGNSHAALVAHFTFDDAGDLGANTGSVATDWSNFAGVTQTTGRFGLGAGNFVAGTSSAWDSDFTVANLDTFTLSMHVKSSQAVSWRDFVSIGTGNNVVFVLERTGSEGVFNYNIGNVGGTGEGQVGYAPGAATFDIDDGAWHHLGLTVGSGSITLYIDGVSRDTATYSGTGAISAFQLASRFGDGARAITTEIDDVAIYDERLNSTQMSWLASNAATAAAPEPSAALFGGFGLLALLRRRR